MTYTTHTLSVPATRAEIRAAADIPDIAARMIADMWHGQRKRLDAMFAPSKTYDVVNQSMIIEKRSDGKLKVTFPYILEPRSCCVWETL